MVRDGNASSSCLVVFSFSTRFFLSWGAPKGLSGLFFNVRLESSTRLEDWLDARVAVLACRCLESTGAPAPARSTTALTQNLLAMLACLLGRNLGLRFLLQAEDEDGRRRKQDAGDLACRDRLAIDNDA